MLRGDNFLPKESVYGGLLPWMIAVMVFLSGVAVSGALSVRDAAGGWRDNLSRSMTVQIVATDAEQREKETEAALAVLNETPEISSAEMLGEADIAALLEPWVGGGDIAAELPVPALIDVYLEPGQALDIAALEARLSEVAPSAVLDSHQKWLSDLLRLSDILQWISGSVLILVGMTTIAIVVFATHAGLAAHRDIIEVVHLIGARDGQIAKAYQWRFLTIGLKGGLLGIVFVFAAFAAIYFASANLGSALLPRLTPSLSALLAVAALPFASALITMVTARIAVLRSLTRTL